MIENILFGIGFAIALGVAGSFDCYPTSAPPTMWLYLLIGASLMLPKTLWLIAMVKESVYNEDEDDIYE